MTFRKPACFMGLQMAESCGIRSTCESCEKYERPIYEEAFCSRERVPSTRDAVRKITPGP